MGLFDWVMKGIGFEPEEEGFFNQDESFVPEPRKKRTKKEKKSLFGRKKKREQDDDFDDEPKDNFDFDRDSYNTQGVKNYGQDYYEKEAFGTGIGSSVGGYGAKNFIFYKTTKYEDVKNLVEYLRQSAPAIVDLNDISPEEAQRILDFISGAICALNGGIQRVTGNIFLLAPEEFNITMPQKDEEID